MDNKKIHIDDYFEQRFRNESNAENIHQAWDKMEQLLDQNKGKRRFLFWGSLNWLIPFVLLTLGGAAGVGFWWNNKNSNKEIEKFAGNAAQPNASALTQQNNTITPTADETVKEKTVDAKNAETKTQPKVQQEPLVAQQPTVKSKKSVPSKPQSPKSGNENKSKTLAKNDVPVNKPKGLNNTQQKLIHVNNEGLATTQLKEKKKTSKSDIASNKKQEKTAQDLKQVADKNLLVVDKKDNNKIKKLVVKEKDMLVLNEGIKKDELTQKQEYYYDTVGYKKIQSFKMIPLTLEEIKALQGLTLVQTESKTAYDLIEIKSFLPSATQESSLLASNEKSKPIASSKKESNTAMNYSFLNDVNQFFETKSNYYTNVFGGFNVTPKALLPFGFHAGAGIHFWMRDKWTLGAELSYAYKVLNNEIVDEAVKNTPTGSPTPVTGGYLYNYKRETTQNTYSFKYLNTFELPILVGYHTEKWSVFAGPSLHYATKMRYKKTSTITTIDTVVKLNSEDFTLVNTNLKSINDDFKARLGLGYNVGVQYNVTDRLGLSFRVSQVLMDNASTEMGTIFSNQMVKIPSLSIGVKYKLNNDKKIKYIMGTK